MARSEGAEGAEGGGANGRARDLLAVRLLERLISLRSSRKAPAAAAIQLWRRGDGGVYCRCSRSIFCGEWNKCGCRIRRTAPSSLTSVVLEPETPGFPSRVHTVLFVVSALHELQIV